MKRITPFSISVLLIPILLMFADKASAQTMNIAPDVINLNTQGNYENIQCIYGGIIPSGYVITSHSIQVSFNGSYVTMACFVDYCPIDNNIFVEINRETFQNNPVVQAAANLGPKVMVINGTFTVTNANGDVIIYLVDRWGYAEIIKPGKKK